MTRLGTVPLLAFIILLAACDPFGSDPGSGSGCGSDGCDISGHVMTEAGNPLQGVKMLLSGGEGGYIVTDKNGYYMLSGNTMMRNYNLTPSKGPWSFEPEKRTYKDLSRNYTGQDFVAARVESFFISGHVYTTKLPLSNVLIMVPGRDTVRTNTSGLYMINNNRGRQDYTIIPYKEGYTFQPEERTITYLEKDTDSQDFLAIEAE